MANPSPGPLLSAVLIVRDEEELLPGCLESLHEIADEIIVHDTGSLDRTRDVARAAGASVTEGAWPGDFGAARTQALVPASGRWVLMVDADERVITDPALLRARLLDADGADGFSVRIDNLSGSAGPGYASWGARVLRRPGLAWVGSVHERPLLDGLEPQLRTMPPHELSLDHLGYCDPDRVRAKAGRNASLAQAELDAMAASGHFDHALVLRTLVDLGRSLMAAGRAQDAVDTFETARDLAEPGSGPWLEATDHLARLLLGAGYDELVVVLSDQLRGAGAEGQYCDWLRAQALAQLGHPGEALDLIRGVRALVDTAGREYDLGQVTEIRNLLEELVRLEHSR
jgi:glycosyl transferase family 2